MVLVVFLLTLAGCVVRNIADPCFTNIYACGTSASLSVVSASDQCSAYYLNSTQTCLSTAEAGCPADSVLVAGVAANAVYDGFQWSCRTQYCYQPLKSCVGTAFRNAYTTKDYLRFCAAFHPFVCPLPLCNDSSVVQFYQRLVDSLCTRTGADAQCYVDAVSCIDYSYYDPDVQDWNAICQNKVTALSCIDATATRNACANVSTAILQLKSVYEADCDQTNLCRYQQSVCFIAATRETPSTSDTYEMLCSNLVTVENCLLDGNGCADNYTAIISQLEQRCAAPLCLGGIQSCYEAYSFNGSALLNSPQDYLSGWCGAFSNIESCLGYRKQLCDLTSFVISNFSSSLNELCTAASFTNGMCYWEALKCFWDSFIQPDAPASFWTTSIIDFCTNGSFPTIHQCLWNAKAACESNTVNNRAVTNIYDIVLSTCGFAPTTIPTVQTTQVESTTVPRTSVMMTTLKEPVSTVARSIFSGAITVLIQLHIQITYIVEYSNLIHPFTIDLTVRLCSALRTVLAYPLRGSFSIKQWNCTTVSFRNGSVTAVIQSTIGWDYESTAEQLFNATVQTVEDDLASPESRIVAAVNGSATSLTSLLCVDSCNYTYVFEELTTGTTATQTTAPTPVTSTNVSTIIIIVAVAVSVAIALLVALIVTRVRAKKKKATAAAAAARPEGAVDGLPKVSQPHRYANRLPEEPGSFASLIHRYPSQQGTPIIRWYATQLPLAAAGTGLASRYREPLIVVGHIPSGQLNSRPSITTPSGYFYRSAWMTTPRFV